MDGLYQVIIDHKEVFEALENPPIILNDLKLDLNTRQGRDDLSAYLTMTFTGEELPHVPTCVMGHIGGEARLGEVCPQCNTRVTHLVDRQLEDCLWLAPPTGVKAFIHPEVWSCIDKVIAPEKNYSLLLWMTDPNCKIKPNKQIDFFERFEGMFKRGINFFHDNFDSIMEFVLQQPWMTEDKQKELWEFVIVHRDMIFQPRLPIPSSVFVVSEKSSRGSLADDITPALLNAVYTITSTFSSPIKLNNRSRESHAARGSAALAKCYFDIATGFIATKPGLIRRQWIGSRQFFTGRAVITPIGGTYHHEEVHLPWAQAISVFEPHLVNLLMKQGYMEDEALAFLEDHQLADDEDGSMRKLFDHMLSLCPVVPGWEVAHRKEVDFESFFENGQVPDQFPTGVFKELDRRHEDQMPLRGYPVCVHRPPTLTRLSIQNLYVTKIKDPDDWSMGVPDSGLVGWNADFDGDELHILLSIDGVMAKSMSRLRQHLGVRSLRRPRQLSEFQRIHAPLAATFMNAVHRSDGRLNKRT